CMRTLSQARNRNRRQQQLTPVIVEEPEIPMADNREARTWLDKEPPRSILTWDDLVSKFINQFFPPSKTTYLRNEIINFLQKPNETFNEAWERFKGLWYGTDISQKDDKPSKKRQNRTRDGKVCENKAKSKSSQLREEKAKKNILEGSKLPNP
ncbi:reverse transcriptase domain-containing protein, partial [Tanacetum coccineum]